MAQLERKKEVLTPKTDKKGTKSIKRETVEVESMPEEIDETKVLQLRKSRIRLIIVFGIVDLLLFGLVVYQVVQVFLQIAKGVSA